MIIVSNTPFDAGERLNAFMEASQNAGAIASFIGRVRGEGGDTKSLYLESYADVTEQGIEDATKRAYARWPLTDILIIHRIGTLHAGEEIVLVATASEHRRAAFEACDFLMDYLKTEAIFWKKEITKSGSTWVEPRTQDYTDNKRWS
ncbi:MAG: molybdenum cofactor biosynthesis protein MoaE [Robiginitomaculum sp.]|nr:MAG: molybdenum cofactor biosynthesis protein MoaE [Robiginitomaculum sp.]